MPATFDYSEITAVADRLISEFGRSITLFRPSTVSATSSEPWKEPETFSFAAATSDQKAVVDAVWIGAGETEFREVSGGLIRRGAAGFLISGTVNRPVEKFVAIDDGGELWKIQKVEVLKPGETVLLYGVEVTK